MMNRLEFSVGEKVNVKNHRNGLRWLCGEVLRPIGPVSYQVVLKDYTTIRSHQDHLRPRKSVVGESQSNVMFEENVDGRHCGNCTKVAVYI